MSPLFELGYRQASYPLAAIERVGWPRRKSDGNRVRLVKVRGEDESLEVHDSAAGQMLMTPLSLLPAAPGTSLLRVWLEDGVPGAGRTPVIAWALCFDGEVRPVTPQGVRDGCRSIDETIYVEMPDGSVQATDAYGEPSFYDNVDAYRLNEGQCLIDEAAAARAEAAKDHAA